MNIGVIWALAIASFMMLLLPISELVNPGYLIPIDTIDPFNGDVIGYWVGLLGGVPVIIALIVIAVTAKGAGWRKSLAHVGAVLIGFPVLLTLLVMAVSWTLATPGEKPFATDSMGRRHFVAITANACMKAGAGASIGVPSAQGDAYCSCAANAMADAVSREEVISPTRAAMHDRGLAAVKTCSRLRGGTP